MERAPAMTGTGCGVLAFLCAAALAASSVAGRAELSQRRALDPTSLDARAPAPGAATAALRAPVRYDIDREIEERGPRSVPRPAEVAWFLAQHESIKTTHFDGKFGSWDNPLGWWEAWYLRAYINMYLASRDTEVLHKLNELLKIVANGNDLFSGHPDQFVGAVLPGWGNTYRGTYGGRRHSSITLNGLYLYPMAAFARIVRGAPGLHAEFAEDADRYLALIAASFEAYKPYIRSTGPYPDKSIGEHYIYPAGYFELQDGRRVASGGMAFPLNMTVIPAEAMAEAYLATGKPEYAEHARRVANYFWWNTRYRRDGQGHSWLEWDYWPGSAKSRPEDPGHAAPAVLFARTMHESGIPNPWNAQRLQLLANTFTQSVLASSTSMHNYINGTGGILAQKDGYICSDWATLRPYDRNNDRTMDIYHACRNLLAEAGQRPTIYTAVFANLYRFNPEPDDRWLAASLPPGASHPPQRDQVHANGAGTARQMLCDQFRCIDPRSGAYTQSGCDEQRCWQDGPIVGYVGRRDRVLSPGRRFEHTRNSTHTGIHGTRFDCSRLRCIELSSGRVWESGCRGDYCYPTRPAPSAPRSRRSTDAASAAPREPESSPPPCPSCGWRRRPSSP